MLVFCYEPSQSSHKIHSCSFESAISKGISVKLANKTCFILPQNLQTPTHLNYFISILSAERFMILFLVAFRSFNTRWKLGYNYGVNSKFPNTRFTIKMVITQETYRKVLTFFFSFFHKTFLTHFLIFWKNFDYFFFFVVNIVVNTVATQLARCCTPHPSGTPRRSNPQLNGLICCRRLTQTCYHDRSNCPVWGNTHIVNRWVTQSDRHSHYQSLNSKSPKHTGIRE